MSARTAPGHDTESLIVAVMVPAVAPMRLIDGNQSTPTPWLIVSKSPQPSSPLALAQNASAHPDALDEPFVEAVLDVEVLAAWVVVGEPV